VPRSLIETLIDRHMKCVRCGAQMGTCRCWEDVTLRCPKCRRTKQVAKDILDPIETATVEATCNQCHKRGLSAPIRYFDSKGQEIEQANAGSVR